MQNIEQILKKVENNFHTKDKKEVEEFSLNGETYEVLLPSRVEAAQILFSKKIKQDETINDLYEWLKPHIYKMFQLKEAAVKAREAGYINTYYEITDMLFSADEIGQIIAYIMGKINPSDFLKKEVDFQKKQ